MRSLPSAVPSQNAWVSSSIVGRSKRIGAVIGALTLPSARLRVLLHALDGRAGRLPLVEAVAERLDAREGAQPAHLLGVLAEGEEGLQGLVEVPRRQHERVGARALVRRIGHEGGGPRARETRLLQLGFVAVAVDPALLLGG